MSLTAERIDAIKATHESTILRVLESIRDAARAEGWDASDPYEMHDDCYRWDIAIYPNGEKEPEDTTDAIDVSVTLAESGPYSGDRDADWNSEGINVILDIVAWGGQIIGGFAPYNYSDRVWTDDDDEIQDRINMLSGIDPESVVSLIREFVERR